MKKLTSLIISFLIMISTFTLASIPQVQALSKSESSNKIKAGKYTFEYGKYISPNYDISIWINKNKTCRYENMVEKTDLNGIWEINETEEYGVLKKILVLRLENGIKKAFQLNLGNNFLGSPDIDWAIKSANPIKLNISKGKTYIKVKWNKANWSKYAKGYGTIGYEIQYSTNKSFKNKKIVRVYSKNTTSKIITNIKGNKKYYFRIRSFIYTKGNYEKSTVFSYNDYSAVKSIKTPSGCHTAKNLTKTQICRKLLNIYKTEETCFIDGKFKLYGVTYYSARLGRHVDGHISTDSWIAISSDGHEMLQGHYDFNKKIFYFY